jgi:hypothetical protein
MAWGESEGGLLKLKIEITMDNAAFEPDNGSEAARILRALADEIDGGNYPVCGIVKPLRDLNGNEVGKARVVK